MKYAMGASDKLVGTGVFSFLTLSRCEEADKDKEAEADCGCGGEGKPRQPDQAMPAKS